MSCPPRGSTSDAVHLCQCSPRLDLRFEIDKWSALRLPTFINRQGSASSITVRVVAEKRRQLDSWFQSRFLSRMYVTRGAVKRTNVSDRTLDDKEDLRWLLICRQE